MNCSAFVFLMTMVLLPSAVPGAEVVTMPSRAGDVPEGVVIASPPAPEPFAPESPAPEVQHFSQATNAPVRISMADMNDLLEKRVDDGVEALNALGARLAERAEDSADSPGYAADWLRWRQMLESLRSVHSWGTQGEPRLGPEPPGPTAEALEAHFLIERERQDLEQSRERHRVEVAEIRATGDAERSTFHGSTQAVERRNPWDVDYFHVTRTIPGSGYLPGASYGYSSCDVVFPRHVRTRPGKPNAKPFPPTSSEPKSIVKSYGPHGSTRSW